MIGAELSNAGARETTAIYNIHARLKSQGPSPRLISIAIEGRRSSGLWIYSFRGRVYNYNWVKASSLPTSITAYVSRATTERTDKTCSAKDASLTTLRANCMVTTCFWLISSNAPSTVCFEAPVRAQKSCTNKWLGLSGFNQCRRTRPLLSKDPISVQ